MFVLEIGFWLAFCQLAGLEADSVADYLRVALSLRFLVTKAYLLRLVDIWVGMQSLSHFCVKFKYNSNPIYLKILGWFLCS